MHTYTNIYIDTQLGVMFMSVCMQSARCVPGPKDEPLSLAGGLIVNTHAHYLSFYSSIYLSTYLSIFLPIYLSFYLSIDLPRASERWTYSSLGMTRYTHAHVLLIDLPFYLSSTYLSIYRVSKTHSMPYLTRLECQRPIACLILHVSSCKSPTHYTALY